MAENTHDTATVLIGGRKEKFEEAARRLVLDKKV